MPATPPLPAPQPDFVLQMQKSGGHLYEVSRAALKALGYAPSEIQESQRDRQLWSLPSGGSSIGVVLGRLGDAITNATEGCYSAAIVSTDALRLWESANGEICGRGVTKVADLGLAGCCSMLMMPREIAGTNWKDTLPQSTVVTSDATAFTAFLKAQGLPGNLVPNIKVRNGGTESLARELQETQKKPVLIFDLVSTGGSAFSYNFCPVASGEESRVVLIRNATRGDQDKLDAFCNEVQKRASTIREAARSLFMRLLETKLGNGASGPNKVFLARRLAEVREMQP